MLYKGRKVEYVRDAAKNDPYYDPEYNQVIVSYVDGEGYETVKESDLDGWDADKRQGQLTDAEKKQAQALDQARKDADIRAGHPVDPAIATAPVVKTVPLKDTQVKPVKK